MFEEFSGLGGSILFIFLISEVIVVFLKRTLAYGVGIRE